MFASRVTSSSSLINLIATRACATSTAAMQITRFTETEFKHKYLEQQKLSIIGATLNAGQHRVGPEQGPAAIRATNMEEKLIDCGWQINQAGDIEYEHVNDDPATEYGMLRSRTCANANYALHQKVYENSANNDFVLTLGGDHSLAIGTISAQLRVRPDTVVVWVDAHADINHDKSSPSGSIHGMPNSFLMHHVDFNDTPGFEWVKDCPKLDPHSIVYVGLRDIDPGEKETMSKLGIKAYSMHDIDRYNIGPIMDRVLNDIDPYGTRPIHLSFDIDALDPSIAPSTGTPVIGGLTFREGAYICEVLAETKRLCSMDLVEVNPTLGSSEDARKTADAAKRLITCALGETLLWGVQNHYRKF